MSGVPAWHSNLKAEAKALGLRRFTSTLACKQGHVGQWLVSTGACSECCRLHSLAKDKANRGKANARTYRYRAKHAEELKRRAKTPENRAKSNAKGARWRALNPEKVKAIIEKRKSADAEYRRRNKDKKDAYAAQYRREHKEKVAACMATWNAKNRAARSAYNAAYRIENAAKIKVKLAENPGRARVHAENRRARKRANGGELSKGIVSKLFTLQRGKCACCHADLKKTTYHLDHMIALSKGGAHDDSNIQLLCKPCNMSKHTMHPVEFMQSRGFLL